MAATSQSPSTTVEATVTSKGQVTLLKELRNRLGIQNGSRIRFNLPSGGPVQVEPDPGMQGVPPDSDSTSPPAAGFSSSRFCTTSRSVEDGRRRRETGLRY